VRGPLRDRCQQDHFPNASDIFHYFIIPNTQYAISVVGQPLIPDSVPFVSSVLATIHLDDEPLFPADKIDNVGPDWLLANKFEAIHSTRPDILPQRAFSSGRIFPKQPG
jgi:hypothetical protein